MTRVTPNKLHPCGHELSSYENKKIIFISVASHFASLWNKGLEQFEKSLTTQCGDDDNDVVVDDDDDDDDDDDNERPF